ncbi:SDR family NAD(P)-dependent oxidoreductase [bacterium]|nr:SDR family NAD(P)-dependent oxidoreductase [bacterium]
MPALSIIAIAPAAPREAFREPALAIAAARAGAVGILDLEYISAEAWVEAYEKLAKHANNGQIGIRCRSGQVGDLSLLTAYNQKDSAQPVLILTASAGRFEQARLKGDIAAGKLAGFITVVEAIDLKEALLAQECGAEAVIAKGHEGAGRVGDGTTFVLVQQFVASLTLPVWAQGGIGLYTAAAVVAAGASGIVLDAQLYLCRDSLISPQARQRLEKFDGSETTVLSGPDGLFRLFAENGSPRLAQLNTALLSQNSYALVHALQANVKAPALIEEDDQLWVIGQDACFAGNFARVGGTVAGAIDAIRQQISLQVAIASKSSALAENSDLAKSHGTRYPIVQGAMTRVSDNSDFAYEVAKAGGLPFLALSLMRAADIEQLLQETTEKLGTMPWGVGLLGFVPPALRQEQMAVVDKFKPPYALIAGGRPDQAKAMEEAGTKTYLHVPSPLLLKSFIEMGSRRFIFEGKECGGHVGPRSSFVLWQSMIEVMLDAIGPRDNASAFHVLFAGGIHDGLSAAMVATLTAPLSARGIKVGFLVGTAYLFTEEAVSSGAIVNKFQQAAIQCDQTVLLETGPGHSIRCIDSPYKEIFDKRRIELQGQNKSRDEIREELELMNLGRLRIASKGLSRGKSSELATIPDDQQWQEGMYMIGQVAALHNKVLTVAELHHNISADGHNLLAQRAQREIADQILDYSNLNKHNQEAIAIVGMSCQFPQSNDVETYWTNILNKVDSITEIPKSHFDWQNYFDANPLARDKIISKWGGFLSDVVFDPAPYGIPPSSLDSIDPMQVLILEAARSALLDAGYNERKFPRDKTSVILANAGHGPITALYSLRSMLGWKLDGLDEETTDQIKSVLPEWTEDSFAGYLGNVAAGRVANRFDLKGINFSIDAACASSLAALYVGVSDLRSHASDVVLLGATDTHNQPGDYLSFSKTHALSPSGRCKTFDAKADGIAISEGIAILVLKRLSDAERDGDRIYAVIKGIAGSSDGRDLSLTAPRPAGQMLALDRAYADAGISPATVQIVEAHGTGTVAGDKAEVEALTNVFRSSGAAIESCAIGSVKTNIGHSKAAAGLASIIKIAKALHHKVLPPTINVSDPSPACKFSEGPFYVNTECRPWIKSQGSKSQGDSSEVETPRRGGVSAFGFGGTNFHAVLEEYVPPCAAETAPVVEAWPAELFVWKANTTEELLKAVALTESLVKKMRLDYAIESNDTSQKRRRLFELASNLNQKNNLKRSSKTSSQTSDKTASSSASLAIVASNIDDLEQKIAQVRDKLSAALSENLQDGSDLSQGADQKTNSATNFNFSLPTGVHFRSTSNLPNLSTSTSSAQQNKIAFLFPGQGSQKVNMLKELSIYFPEILETVEEADRYIAKNADKPGFAKFANKNALSQYIFPAPTLSDARRADQQEQLTSTDIAQPALGVCDLAMLRLLSGFGLKADMVAGHSYGEYVALHAGGVFSAEDLLMLSIERGRILGQCAAENPGAMAAIAAAPDLVIDALKQMPGVYLANINTPTQSIISGSEEAIEGALEVFKSKQIAAKRIAVSAAFHSPLMTGSDQQLAEVLHSVQCHSPKIPVFSNSTTLPYGSENAEIVKQLSQHALKPVLFVDQLKAMHDAGARLFIEVGPGSVLTGLAEASLANREFVAVNCDRSGRNSLEHFLSTLGRLAVNGADIDLGKLFWNRLFNSKARIRSHFAAGKQLLYKVNSVSIARIKEGEPSALAPAKNLRAQISAPQTTSALKAPPVVAPQPPTAQNKAITPNNTTAPSNTITASTQHLIDVKARQTNGQLAMDPNNRKNGIQPVGRPDQNVDKVMLEFQQSMLEMTNRFLETQQNVMLAYLQANGRGTGYQPQLPQLNQQLPQQMNSLPVSQVVQTTTNTQPMAQAPMLQTTGLPYPEQATGTAYDAGSNGNGSYGGNGANPSSGLNANNGASVYNGANGNGKNGENSNTTESAYGSAAQALVEPTAQSNLIDAEALAESLFEIVSERTGYPRSMLDPTLDLEADLGIDSIKRVEILNNFRKLLPESTQTKLETGIEKLAGTKTLQGIVDWINTLNDIDETEGTEDSAATQVSPNAASTAGQTAISSSAKADNLTNSNKPGNLEKVARGVVVPVELPPAKATTKALAPVTLIIADQQEPAKQIAALLDGLDKSLGAKNNILINRKSLVDEQAFKQVMGQIRDNFGPIGAVINICNVISSQASPPQSQHLAQLSQLSSTFLLAKAVENDLKGHAMAGRHASFVNVTYLGGDFNGSTGQTNTNSSGQAGLNLPQLAYQGGVVGLTKTIAKEMPGVHVKVVDLNLDTTAEEAAKSILSELFADDDIVEVGFVLGKRLGLIVKEAPYESILTSTKPALNSSSVVLVTGGARGITAKITLELAKKYKPTFVIVGRLPRPKETESASTAGLTAAKDIKAALIDERQAAGQTINVRDIEQTYQHLLREREVRSSLEALQAAGATAKYYSVDIADAAAFGDLIDSIYETSNIDGVIHGAGIIEDALIKDKTLESFQRVYDTKIKGAITLAEKVRFETLQFMYFFSSVVGRTGNSGQADYVSANEALNKLALNLKTRTTARVASLMWGPWQAGMAPPELEAVFASHGWSMIQPEDGSLCFLEEIGKTCPEQVEVMLVGKLSSKPSDASSKITGAGAVTGTAASTAAIAPAPIVRAQLAAKKPPLTLLPPSTTLVPAGILLNTAQVDPNNTSFLLRIDTKKHVYLQDHKFDGIPVLPMAVALELMLEAARAVYPDRQLVQVSDLDIPSGIVFHTAEKDFIIEVGIDADDENTVAVQLLSASPRKAHFRCKAKFSQQAALCPEIWNTELAAPIQSKFNLRDLPASTSELPQPKDLYGTWLFHGPAFQGLASIICLATNDIAGEITGSAPLDFVTTADSSAWTVDPLLLDSAMQLAGVWARHHQDVTVLPNGFRNMYLLRPISLGTVKARVYLGASSATDLLCDLAIYNENGELAVVVEGLGGIASKTFNRFASSPPVQELAR